MCLTSDGLPTPYISGTVSWEAVLGILCYASGGGEGQRVGSWSEGVESLRLCFCLAGGPPKCRQRLTCKMSISRRGGGVAQLNTGGGEGGVLGPLQEFLPCPALQVRAAKTLFYCEKEVHRREGTSSQSLQGSSQDLNPALT